MKLLKEELQEKVQRNFINLINEKELINDFHYKKTINLWGQNVNKKNKSKHISEDTHIEKVLIEYPIENNIDNYLEIGCGEGIDVNYLQNNYKIKNTYVLDIGENIYDNRTFLQVELSQKEGIDYLFQDYNDSMIKYDHVGEPLAVMFTSLNQIVNLDDLTVDLYGNKDLANVKTEYILTAKLASEPIRSFARKLKPHELNIIQNISGNEIRLAKTSNCENKKKYRKSELSYYYSIPTYHLNSHDLRHYKNLLSVKYKMSYLKIIFGYPIYLKFLSLKRKISNYISKNIYE